MNQLLALLLALGVAGCAQAPMKFADVQPMVAYHTADIDRVINAVSRATGYNKVMANLSAYGYFSNYEFGKTWLRKPSQRLLVVGYPAECAISSASWRRHRQAHMIKETLSRCLTRIEKYTQETGIACGCRVVAMNDTIFAKPEELQNRDQLPIVAVVRDGQGMRQISATAITKNLRGHKKELRAFNKQGREICHGTYNVREREFRANMDISCFDGRVKGKAVYNTGGVVDGRAYGTALLKTADTEMLVVYGLTETTFEKYKSEILGHE